MGLISIVGGIVGAVGGFVASGGNPVVAIAGAKAGSSIGSSIDGKNATNKATDKAAAIYKEGAEKASGILTTGYNDARDAKLAALAKVGALTPEQYQQTVQLLNQGNTDYVDTLIASAEGYAGEMQGGGAAYRTALTGAGAQYEISINEAVDQYGTQIEALAQEMGVDFDTAAQMFADGLNQSSDRYTGELVGAAEEEAAGLDKAAGEYSTTRMKGLNAVTSAMTPYVEGRGTDALDSMSRLMNADPTTLDPAQARMRESYLRDSAARLSASGLRGAGRAGVAAVNEGDAALRAQLYSDNRDRAVTAGNQIAQLGYGASGQVGAAGERAYSDVGNVTLDARGRGISAISSAKATGANYGATSRATGLQAINSAADRGAVARQTAGTEAARAKAAAGDDIAKTQLGLGKDAAINDQSVAQKIAGVNLDIGGKAATQVLETNKGVIGASDRAYTQAREVAGKEGDVNAEAITGRSAAQAGAVADPAYINAQAEIAKGAVKAETIGNIASSAGDLIVDLLKPKNEAD